MKLETRNTNEAWPTHAFRNRRDEEKYPKPIRTCLPLMSLRLGTAASRAYLGGLRAAEMAAWELSGGDYLLSCCATPVSLQLR